MSTPEMLKRNEDICAYYKEGRSVKECTAKFALGRQRILQILHAAGAWKPKPKAERTEFVGVNVTKETKKALVGKAGEKGVSKYVSDVLDEVAGK